MQACVTSCLMLSGQGAIKYVCLAAKGGEGTASRSLRQFLRIFANVLETPVLAILVLFLLLVIFLLGSLIVEYFTERRKLCVEMPKLFDALRAAGNDLSPVIMSSGLLRRQKKLLHELTLHGELTNDMRESLALRLLDEESKHYADRVRFSDLAARLAPMFGLLGTLIPLGPGIVALSEGDTLTLSRSLLVAFDTTVAGLIAAAVAVVISQIRKKWYSNYSSILEALGECVLEMTALSPGTEITNDTGNDF